MYAGVGGAQALTAGYIGIIFMVIQAALEALAIPGLFKQQRNAWELLFVAALVGLVHDLVSLNLVGLVHDLVSLNLFGLVLNFLISFYILYQIKSYYKH